MQASSIKIPYTRPPMYEKQQAFVDSPARYTIVEASTKTGKTIACLIWLFEQAIKGKSGDNFWWVAPVYVVAGIAYSRLKKELTEARLPSGVWTARDSDRIIELVGGRKIWFKSADKPDNLYGDDVAAAVIDEATRCKPEAWYAVRSTLTATRGPIKIIGNVRGKKNWAYQMARKAEAGEPDHAYFRLTAYDAVEGGVLELAEVEDAKRNLPDSVFKELYLAVASEDGSNPFGIAAIRKCIKPMSTNPAACHGIDLAKSHDWAVNLGLDAAGITCHLDRWQGDWASTKRRILDCIGDKPTLIDSTGVGDPIVEDINRERPNATGFKFSSTSKQQLMEGLAASIQRGEIGIPEGWLIDELECFEYEYHAGGVRYSAPAGLHDDGVCALALADEQRRRMTGSVIDVRLLGGGSTPINPKNLRELIEERTWHTITTN